MEEQYRQTPPQRSGGYAKGFWHVWSPLLIKWGIAAVVSTLAMMALIMAYAARNEQAVISAMESEDQMLGIYNKIFEQYFRYSALIEGVAAAITIPIMAWLFRRDRMAEKRQGISPAKKPPVYRYAALLLMALTLSVGLNNLIIISNFSSYSETYQNTMEALYSAAFPIQLIALGILIPICEELVFRGLIYQRLKASGTVTSAMLYSAFVFGLMHGNVIQMLYGFFLGLMLAWIYERYASVWAPVTAHMIMNIFSVVATQYKIYEWLAKDIRYIGGVTIACAAIGACMYLVIQRMNGDSEDSYVRQGKW